MQIYHDFNTPPKVKIDFKDSPSLAQQHFANEVDINQIMERYHVTGILGDPTKPATKMPQFGDFTGVDFYMYQNKMAEAMQNFAQLPATLREYFGNDAGNLLSFLADENNREEAEKLGLINPLQMETQIVNKEQEKQVVKTTDQSST